MLGRSILFIQRCLFICLSSHLLREGFKQPGIFLRLLGMRKVQVLAVCCLMISDIKKKEGRFFISLLTTSPKRSFAVVYFSNSIVLKKVHF